MTLEQLRARLAEIHEALRGIDTAAGGNDLTRDQNTQWDTLITERTDVERQITEGEAEERAAQRRRDERRQIVADAVARSGGLVSGDGAALGAPNVIIRQDPLAVIDDRSVQGPGRSVALRESLLRTAEAKGVGSGEDQSHFEGLLKRHLDPDSQIAHQERQWAEGLLARSTPAYVSGWKKTMAGKGNMLVEVERAAMNVGTGADGGYLVPFFLDPTVMLSNAGTANAIRPLSRIVTVTTGNTWHGVTSAGMNASWTAEGAEVTDGSPTFVQPTVPLERATAFAQATIEAFEDIDGLAQDLLMLFADARDRLEGAAHAVGTGSGQPTGIFTAIYASSSLQVQSLTNGAIALADLQALYDTVPVRWRRNSTFVLATNINMAIKALGTALSASYSTNITEKPTGVLLGLDSAETDDAPSLMTTTALDPILMLGDFKAGFLIADKPGSMSLEFIPNMFGTSANLPNGTRGWFAHWRTGANAVNPAAFRVLVNKTSA